MNWVKNQHNMFYKYYKFNLAIIVLNEINNLLKLVLIVLKIKIIYGIKYIKTPVMLARFDFSP